MIEKLIMEENLVILKYLALDYLVDGDVFNAFHYALNAFKIEGWV